MKPLDNKSDTQAMFGTKIKSMPKEERKIYRVLQEVRNKQQQKTSLSVSLQVAKARMRYDDC